MTPESADRILHVCTVNSVVLFDCHKPPVEQVASVEGTAEAAGPGAVAAKKDRSKGWISLGSEKEVEEERILATRELVCYVDVSFVA